TIASTPPPNVAPTAASAAGVPPVAMEPQNQSFPELSLIKENSRFSRTAIAGAGWMAFFLIVPLLLFWKWGLMQGTPVASSPGEPSGPAWWQVALRLLILMVMFLCVTAPFGATILGWVSVNQICRSAG